MANSSHKPTPGSNRQSTVIYPPRCPNIRWSSSLVYGKPRLGWASRGGSVGIEKDFDFGQYGSLKLVTIFESTSEGRRRLTSSSDLLFSATHRRKIMKHAISTTPANQFKHPFFLPPVSIPQTPNSHDESRPSLDLPLARVLFSDPLKVFVCFPRIYVVLHLSIRSRSYRQEEIPSDKRVKEDQGGT